jgi:hypothetical protein
MPRTIETTVFKFEELSDEAKEKARDWYREGALDHDWWENTYDDAATCGKLIGIDIKQKPVTLVSGKTRYDPAIWFSGFCSQGDGACYEARYRYVKGGAKALREHAPKDETLHRIADGLQALQRANLYRLTAETEHSGHYYHSGCMSVNVWRNPDDRDVSADTEKALTRLLRDFADWIYRQMEAEHDYQMSDEVVDETISANEYEFTESGRRAV